jgi:hypothetical protein
MSSCGIIHYAKAIQIDTINKCEFIESKKKQLFEKEFEGNCTSINFDKITLKTINSDTLTIEINNKIIQNIKLNDRISKNANTRTISINQKEIIWLSNRSCILFD